MKKLTIGALVGGIILFFWQFISWAAVNFHKETQQYTRNQVKILEFLEENLEEGFYYMPGTAPGEDPQKVMEESIGKPWAQIYYHENMQAGMGMSMTRGLIVDILAVALLAWILLKMGNASFITILLSSLAVGLIGYLTINYTQTIWYELPSWSHLLDAFGSWGLIGLWLGWWLRK